MQSVASCDARRLTMNAEDKPRIGIGNTQGALDKVEAAIDTICAKTEHPGFKDAKRVIDLTDREDALDSTLRHEEVRRASDRDS